jgi:GTPase
MPFRKTKVLPGRLREFRYDVVKFADEALIEVSSGNGGNGCIAFLREANMPMGGPSGGDGGRGGDVIFEVRRNLRTLSNLRYKRSFKAENGHDGTGRGRYGHNGEDIIIPVPPGTIVKDAETDEVLKDFAETEGSWKFLTGGNGGWGNIHYKSSTNQAPRFAQPGKPGKSVKIKLELAIIADIGLVGFPNAGKSSLLDYFTNARPKIAAYPFTTKIPNLGVLRVDDRDVVIADIPGIIEGAAEGLGLGLKFLKHISRTVAIAFMIDLSDDNFLTAFDILSAELASFDAGLADKERIIVGTKLDLEESSGRLEELRAKYPAEVIYGISVFSREGMDELRLALLEFIKE